MKVTRKEMIDELTGSMFDAMECDADYRWNLCKEGFKGFNNYTDEELEKDYREFMADLYGDEEEEV
jgi:hypothetical protein